MADHLSRTTTVTRQNDSSPTLTQLVLSVLRMYRALSQLGLFQVLIPSATQGCRFPQSCSLFAIEVIQQYGLQIGGRVALKRLGQCHPWGQLNINTP